MTRQFKSVSMMLFLLAMSAGPAMATTGNAPISAPVVQQSETATGTVVDALGPVIGASVIVKGTTNGVITDFDGNFSLAGVNKGDILEISFVGYTTQEIKWNGTPLNVTLKEDTQQLEEVVVLGYGVKQKRGKLTNSVSKVSEETLSVGSYGDPAQALVGAVSGVKVKQTSGFAGSTPSITLRGGTSYNGTGSPLVIVDGQIRTDGLSDLNPNDIESMDVLKDAGATAIYGARAANGVILVTTKSGKQGKATINFNMKVGTQHYVAPYEMMDAEGYIYWLRKAYNETDWCTMKGNLFGGYNNSSPIGIASTELTKNSIYNVMKYTGSSEQQNLINNHGWAVMDDPISDNQILYKGTDVADYNLQNAMSQEYNLTFSGGNDRGKYYAGLGYYDAEGLGYGTYYNRYSFAFNGSYKISDWLESNSIFNYNRANWLSEPVRSLRGDSYMFGRLVTTPPTVRLEDEEGNMLLGISTADANFQYQADQFYRDNESTKFNMTQTLEATLFKGFKVKGTMAWSYSESLYEGFDKDYYQNQAGTSINKSRYTKSTYARTFNQTYNIVAMYDGQFGDHAVSAMAGMEYWDKSYRYLAADGREAPTDDFMDLEYTSKAENKRGIDTKHEKERILSYFGRAQYDYQGRYIFAFTFREDGYSRLINNRWGFFPGVSAGWVASEEKFYEPLADVVNYAKVRASYGVNGSIDGNYIGIYTLHGKYGRSSTYNGNVGYTLATLPNPNLRWEKTRTAEIGLDLGFLNNKYTLGFTYYNRVTQDKYATLTFPSTTGYTGVTNNNGEFRNRGIEIDVNANLINTKDFTWTLTGNISYNKNTVLKLPYNGVENNRQGGTQIYTGNGTDKHYVGGLQEGMTPYNVMVGFVTDKMVRSTADLVDGYADVSQSIAVYYGQKGLDKVKASGWNGKAYELAPGDLMFKDLNGDGLVDQYDQKVIGTTTPKWNGGISTTLKYKGLSLYVRTDFGLGFTTYDGFGQWVNGCAQGAYNMTTDVWDTWTEDNPNAKYPKYVWADFLGKNNWNRTSDFWATKGNYLAFREVQLSYTLPKNWVNKFRCQNLTLSVTGQNLGYLTSSSTPIPDYAQYSHGNTGGYGGTYPLPVTVLFGLNVTF